MLNAKSSAYEVPEGDVVIKIVKKGGVNKVVGYSAELYTTAAPAKPGRPLRIKDYVALVLVKT